MALNWTKLAVTGTDGHAGYTATGASGCFYSILKHGSRFRLAAGGGHDDQKVGTLAALKTVCEKIESVTPVAAETVQVELATGVIVSNGDLIHSNMILPTEGEQRETPTVPPTTGSSMIPVPPVQTTEHPVKTACGATLLIAAETPERAAELARSDGFLVAVDPPVVVPVPPVDPDTDLDFIVPNDHPTAPVIVPDVQPTEPHPDTETPLAPTEPDQNDAGAVGFHRPTFDRDSVPAVLDRAVMYRDMSWRPGGFLAPVRRYGTIRNNR